MPRRRMRHIFQPADLPIHRDILPFPEPQVLPAARVDGAIRMDRRFVGKRNVFLNGVPFAMAHFDQPAMFHHHIIIRRAAPGRGGGTRNSRSRNSRSRNRSRRSGNSRSKNGRGHGQKSQCKCRSLHAKKSLGYGSKQLQISFKAALQKRPRKTSSIQKSKNVFSNKPPQEFRSEQKAHICVILRYRDAISRNMLKGVKHPKTPQNPMRGHFFFLFLCPRTFHMVMVLVFD